MGQSNGVLLKEVAAFRRCPLIEVSLYTHTNACLFVVMSKFIYSRKSIQWNPYPMLMFFNDR